VAEVVEDAMSCAAPVSFGVVIAGEFGSVGPQQVMAGIAARGVLGEQVSLGQFGLVAVGAVMAAHLGNSLPLVVLMLFAGAVTAVVAVLVGLPALRVRGLYLAVSTLAFALWMQQSVLSTSCWTVPLVGKQLCTGLPNPASTLISRPSLCGSSSM